MSFVELSIAIMVLLVTPGPTNTLLFLAGSERGWVGALRLIPFELVGYLTTVVPLSLMGAAYLHDAPRARAVLAVVAGIWVGWLAIKLILPQASKAQPTKIGPADVLVTTLLNPKALLFGLVLLPSPVHLTANIALFAAEVVLVACGWAALGAWMGRTGSTRPGAMTCVRRGASLWLSVVAMLLLAKGLGAG